MKWGALLNYSSKTGINQDCLKQTGLLIYKLKIIIIPITQTRKCGVKDYCHPTDLEPPSQTSFYLLAPFHLHCPSHWSTFSLALSCCLQRGPAGPDPFSGYIKQSLSSTAAPNCWQLLGELITLQNGTSAQLHGI